VVGDDNASPIDESLEPALTVQEAELKFRKSQKIDSNSFIRSLYFKPVTRKCELLIPLCRMIALPLVRPILQSDIRRLEQDFIDGYRGGDRCFYVSTTNDQGASMDVSSVVSDSWSSHWIQRNKEFEEYLLSDPDLAFLSNKMFHVWDGNHRLLAWYPYIERHHQDEYDWHYSVEARLLLTLGHTGVLINAMNDNNRFNVESLPFHNRFLKFIIQCQFCYFTTNVTRPMRISGLRSIRM
jgi:hypothetical protein